MSEQRRNDEAVLELLVEARYLRARAEAERIAAELGRPGGVRNVPCPCGSGRKYKRCCGEKR